MPKKIKSIPVNHFGDEYNSGISIERIFIKELPAFEGEQSHRHDRHSFFLLEKGKQQLTLPRNVILNEVKELAGLGGQSTT